MAAERIIGVDFGTSTSVIRVKRYQDGKPVGDPLETKPVTFNMGQTMVPTLIQRLPTGDAYFGHEAEIAHRNAKTFQNFKVDIENPDEGIRRQAWELTAEYFTYLAKSYRAQSEGGHLGESDDRERTIISYPVKWNNETKAFMIQTAKDAGFPNVEGVDEAQAAIQAVTVQNADLLTRKGYFQKGVPINILLIDMGAGTTDLVLCRHTPGTRPKTDILSTWPQGGNALFGGREVDTLLRSYISKAMPEDGADLVMKKISIEKYKAWKEGSVSPSLEKGEDVDYFAELDYLLNLMDIDAEYSVSRTSLEDFAADYLRQFPDLVRGCLRTAEFGGDNVDLVILTGGHSRWYFVREMLSGNLDRFGKIGLEKIQADPERIIPITLPQETVALGLVYGPLKINPLPPPPPPPPPPPSDVFPLKYDPCSRIRPVIAASRTFTVGIQKSGAIIMTLPFRQYELFNSWRDVVAIAVKGFQIIVLKKDGTVDAAEVSIPGFRNRYNNQHDVSGWRDIMAIAAGESHTVGLKRTGTVVAVGDNDARQCDVDNWRDIVEIAAGHRHTVGLKKDGTVIAVGDNEYDQCNVSSWRDIVGIAAGHWNTVGLKKDGTVVAVGYNTFNQCNVSDWRDIVAIAVRGRHTVGLKKDGTVIAVGDHSDGQCNVSDWRDIVAIAAGESHTVGLKKDGTVTAVGGNKYRQTDVGEYVTRTESTLFGLSSKTVRVKQAPWKLF